jgi:hypothetical protein
MDLEHCLHWLHLEPTHLAYMLIVRVALGRERCTPRVFFTGDGVVGERDRLHLRPDDLVQEVEICAVSGRVEGWR